MGFILKEEKTLCLVYKSTCVPVEHDITYQLVKTEFQTNLLDILLLQVKTFL